MADDPKAQLARKLLHVAWMSIALGVVLQLLVLLVQQAWPASALAELTGKITWSVVVCSAIAVGTAAGKAAPAAAGVLGLLGAPAAINLAWTTQKAVAAAIVTAPATAAATFTVLPAPGGVELTIAKAVQYALFGFFIAKVNARPRASLGLHAAVGFTAGLLLTVYVLVRTLSVASPGSDHLAILMARLINELAFPIGCSVVVWGATALAKAGTSVTPAPQA